MASAKKKKLALDVAVEFQGVSIGDETGRVGIAIDRENMNIDVADEAFCGRRLSGSIITVPKGVDPSQQEIFEEGERHEIAGTFDVKRFSADSKRITAGLTFALAEIKIEELVHFAKRSGRMEILEFGELPDGEEGE